LPFTSAQISTEFIRVVQGVARTTEGWKERALPTNPSVGGYNSNFFSGRVYDPQALYTDDHTLTIVFAAYDTPQPSNNLRDYRTVGRFQLPVLPGYFTLPSVLCPSRFE
jgi:hypothetical protein